MFEYIKNFFSDMFGLRFTDNQTVPKNWRDAYSIDANKNNHKHIYSDLIAERLPQKDEAYHRALSRIQNLKFTDKIPIKYLETIVEKSILYSKRNDISVNDLKPYFPNESKYVLQSMCTAILNCISYTWEELRSERLGLEWCIIQSTSCRHSHFNNTCIRLKQKIPNFIINDEEVTDFFEPGCSVGCQCLLFPIINVESITGKLKIFDGKKITPISKNDFLKIYRSKL